MGLQPWSWEAKLLMKSGDFSISWLKALVLVGGGKVHDHFLTKSVSLLHLPFLPSTSACLHPPSSGTWSSFNLLHLLTSQIPAQMVFPKINHGFLSADQQLIKRRLIKVAAVFRLFSPVLFSSAR